MKKVLPFIFILFIISVFFQQFFFKGLLPIPSDTIIGLYHPYRDLYVKDYPRGIPFKNFLITDPVRQQYPWKELVVSVEKKFRLPLWNPYNLAGTPLLANFQSAAFYPLNILFFFIPFHYAWSILVMAQPLLAGLFLYLYLKNIGLTKTASFLGGVVFSFSGFSIAWLEWNTVGHVALWLPLILLSIDRIFYYLGNSISSKLLPRRQAGKTRNSKLQLKTQSYKTWIVIFIFSLTFSFLAGHIQTFFYLFLITTTYFIARWVQQGKLFNILFIFLIFYILFFIVTAVQWVPTLQFILLSARDVDQTNWQQAGWFIPWQHLIQFIVPDFFGNPTTLNYWGVWNYAELVGYTGIASLILALYALFFRRDRKTLFFGSIFFLSLIFSLPTALAKIPYILNIPFFSTSQPTRLLFLVDFSLAILAALGFDRFTKTRDWKIFYPITFVGFILVILWIFVLKQNLLVSKQNLFLPTGIFILLTLLIFSSQFKFQFLFKSLKFTLMIRIIIVGIVVFDLFRFGWKFTPFTKKEYLFPNTKAIEFLQKNIGNFRIMATDARIFPPNFSSIYRLQSIDGYDPLYLRRYAELIAASERGKPDISPPFGFNRIITPQNFDSKIIDLLGVKYVLSLSDISSPKVKKVFQEGQTRIYENKKVLPRAFFVEQLVLVNDRNEAIKSLFREDFNLGTSALFERNEKSKFVSPARFNVGQAEIINYSENNIIIRTENLGDGFLVLTDTFYPTWRARIDGKETKIYQSDYNFRGIIVPKGKHAIEFYISLL